MKQQTSHAPRLQYEALYEKLLHLNPRFHRATKRMYLNVFGPSLDVFIEMDAPFTADYVNVDQNCRMHMYRDGSYVGAHIDHRVFYDVLGKLKEMNML